MNIWQILGIEKTKSEEEIIEAYREQLVFYNPEDDAEGFMRLRQAYDEAIRYCRSEADPYEHILEKASEIYGRFRDRIDVQRWRELLQEDLFQQLDSRLEAETRLIYFLMEHYRLPQDVFALFVEEFDWADRSEELGENFAPGFFDYVFDVVNNGEYYKMAYFDGDDYADYDRFIELCMSYASFLQSDPEKALELEAEIDQLEIYHPYYNEEKAELSMLGNNYERAEELTRDFPSLYPDEERLLVCRLRSLMMLRRLDEARELAEKLKVLDPEHRLLKLFAIFLLSEEDIESAKDEYYEFNRRNSFGEDAAELAQMLNERLIPHLEEKGSELTGMEKVTLAWCYYEGDDLEKAYQFLDSFEPEDDEVGIKYYKLKGYLSVYTSRFEQAIKDIDCWEQMRKKKEASEEEKKLHEDQEYIAIYRSKIQAYLQLNNPEKAEEYLKLVISLDDRNLDAYITLSNLFNDQGRFEEIVEMNTEAMQRNGEVGPLLYLTGFAEFRQEHYGDAFRLLDAALETMPYLARAYHYKLLMYDGLDFPNDFEAVLEEMKNADLDPISPKLMELHEIKLLRMKNNLDEAQERILRLLEETTDEEEGLGNDDHALIVQEASIIYRERKEYEKAIEYIDRAIRYNPLNRSIELDKGYLLVLNKQYADAIAYYGGLIEKYPSDAVYHIRMAATKKRAEDLVGAIEHYQKAIELDPERLDIHTYLAEAYSDYGDKKKSIESKTYVLERDPSAENYYERGALYYRFRKTQSALEDLSKAREMNPYDSDTLALYGLCAMQLNDLPAAEEAFLKSMEYLDIENFRHNPYLYILMVYFRQKRYDMVVEAGLTLIEKFGAGTWILIKLIEAYYGLGQMEEVQKCFKKLFELQENHAGGHYTYAVFLHHTKGPRAAQEYFAKILRKYPKDPMIVKNAGLYYYMFLMDFENASGFYEKAFEMTTQDLDFDYINLYESLWYAVRTKKGTLSDSFEIYSSRVNTMRQFEMEQYFSTMTGQVERYFEQYGEYEREDYHYFDLVAEAYFYNGNLDSAEKYARMALNTPMEESDTVRISFDALFVMGLVHESRGELEQAREYYKRLREETEGSFYDYPIHREALERICRKLSGALPVKEGFRLKSLFSRKS